jgi:replicative DNA helicase
MSTKVANLTGYITDYEGEGFAADSEHMRNASFDTKFFGKNKKVTIQPGFYVLRGAPAAGKTAFMLQMCNDFARNVGKHITYYTFKESMRELAIRSLACAPAVNQSNKQKFRKISDCEYFIGGSIQSVFCDYGYRIHFTECSANMKVHELKASVENNAIDNVIFIDGLQDLILQDLMLAGSFADMLKQLKIFQKEHNLVVIASFSDAYADNADKRAIMNYADVVWDLRADEVIDDDGNKTNIRLTWTKNRFDFVSDAVYSYYPEYNIFL